MGISNTDTQVSNYETSTSTRSSMIRYTFDLDAREQCRVRCFWSELKAILNASAYFCPQHASLWLDSKKAPNSWAKGPSSLIHFKTVEGMASTKVPFQADKPSAYPTDTLTPPADTLIISNRHTLNMLRLYAPPWASSFQRMLLSVPCGTLAQIN